MGVKLMIKVILQKLTAEYKKISNQHQTDLAYYGEHYRRTLSYELTEFNIRWIDLKINVLKAFIKL